MQSASPCIQYLMALRSHLLQATILYESLPDASLCMVSSSSYHDTLEVGILFLHHHSFQFTFCFVLIINKFKELKALKNT